MIVLSPPAVDSLHKKRPHLSFGPLAPVPAEQSGGVEDLLVALGGGQAEALPPIFHVRGVLSEADVASALRVASAEDTLYNTDADSVDGQASHELYPLYRGSWQHPALEMALRSKVEGRILPYVRTRFSCPNCVLCDSLLRRYRPGERRGLQVHFDDHAFVTVTFPLNAGTYQGGLFAQRELGADHMIRIRRGPKLTSRRISQLRSKGLWPLPRQEWLEGPFLRPGDALVHQSELLHGVRTLGEGIRYSIVFWIARSLEACLEEGPQPEA